MENTYFYFYFDYVKNMRNYLKNTCEKYLIWTGHKKMIYYKFKSERDQRQVVQQVGITTIRIISLCLCKIEICGV